MAAEHDHTPSAPAILQTFAEGSEVGRYRILRRLGSGAMGDVFLAEDPTIERQVAIKAVRLEARRQEDVDERRGRMQQEARAAGKLSHTHIVTLFDVGEQGGVLYLALEYVDGRDLQQRLESGPPLTLRQCLGVLRQTAEGLAFAHEQGILHRDVKPSNLLLDAEGRVKISDFGIAKVMGEASDLTTTGMLIGSPQYLSPEQIQGEELDGRIDVFSLGVVAYEMLAGTRPFRSDVLSTLIYQIVHTDPPPLRSFWPAVPQRLERLLRRMLVKDREDRIESAAAVAAEVAAIEGELPRELLDRPLERSLGGDGIPTQALDSAILQRRTARRRNLKWAALLAGGVLLAVLGVLLVVGGRGRPEASDPQDRARDPAVQATGEESGSGPGIPALTAPREVGLAVVFHIQPEDTLVLVNGQFVGRARGLGDPDHPYRFPAAGEYRVRLEAPGLPAREIRLRVDPEIDTVITVEESLP